MELEHLRTFVTVADLGSMSATAKHLNLSVSSVSAHIKALEAEWQSELFLRSNRGVKLTERGEIAVQSARLAIQQADDLSQKMRNLGETAKTVIRIGVSVSSNVFDIRNFVDGLKPLFSNYNIQISYADTISIVQNVRSRALDMAIVYGKPQDNELTVQQLASAHLVVAIPRIWQDEKADELTLLETRPWIQAGKDCPYNDVLFEHMGQWVVEPAKFISVNDDRSRRELVAAGVGVSVLEASEARHPDIAIIDRFEMPCDVSFVYHKTMEANPLVAMIRQYLHYGVR